MTDRDKFIRAFENINPSERVVNDLLDIKSPKIKAHRIRRAAVPALCACFILSIGAAAAAAVNDIGFSGIFANYMHLDDSELSEKLVGTVSNVKYSISDSDFMISVKGAASTDDEIIVVIEISPKDGSSAAEHFENPADNKNIWNGEFESYIGSIFAESCGRGSFPSISDDGNIELMLMYHNGYPGKKCTLYAEGSDFYSEHPRDITADAKKLLSVDWKIKLDFSPSEENNLNKKYSSSEADFALYYQDRYDDSVNELSCHMQSAEAGAYDVKLKFSYEEDRMHSMDFNCEQNSIFIVKTDGTHIPMKFDWYMGGSDMMEMGFTYNDGEMPVLLNTDDIAGISINGTAFDVK